MIQELLQKAGLTENETAIFLCVYQNKKIQGARIASATGINRATVYTVLRELIKKKFVIEDLGGGIVRYYSPASFDEFSHIIAKQEQELKERKQLYTTIEQELRSIPSTGKYSVPKIRFIDELRLKDFLINESAKWLRSGEQQDGTWWGFQDASLVEEYPEWPHYFFSQYSGKTTLKILTNEKQVEKNLKKKYVDRQEVRYITDEEFTATHVVIGDYILMIMTQQHPHYLIEIHDTVMASNLRAVFKRLWERAN